jgi:hypothetical protein
MLHVLSVERRATLLKNAKMQEGKGQVRSGQEGQGLETTGNGDGLSARSRQTVSATH